MSQIMKSLKKYDPVIYKKCGPEIQRILNEFECFKEGPVKKELLSQLEKACCQIVFDLEEEKI